MNKKLLALAVAGACVAPSVMAQTASPITLYGRVYVMVESVESDTNSNRSRVSDQSSLLGVRGTEDLGGGLKAWFQLETGFAADAVQTTFATRNSGVGLQGGWGSVMAGRWDMPFKSAAIVVDPYGDLTISGITGTLSDRGGVDQRAPNVIQYWSPNMGGLAFRVAATADENKGTATERQDFGANLTYSKGPLYAFLAYEEHQLQNADEEGYAIGGSYAFGSFKLGGQYQNIDKGAGVELDNWMGNVVWTAGKHQFIYQYMQSELDSGPKCDSNSVGYQYNWTKRTFFLATYIQVDNDPGQNCNFGAPRLTIDVARGEELKGFAAGIRHVF
jgi:predicted porin